MTDASVIVCRYSSGMAERGMISLVAAAAGAAAGTGAAQLGLGYGLGVVVWPVLPAADSGVWIGSLCWATWIAAGATVAGAVTAARLGHRRRPQGPWRLALVAASAIGALTTVALIALPARGAVRVDTYSPVTLAAGYAIVGILLGMAVAYGAVVSRPVAANLLATAVWVWALPAAAVVAGLISGHASPLYLTSWQFLVPGGSAWYGTFAWPDSALTLLITLLAGGLAAWPAVRGGRLGLGTAVSGAAGPLLLAAVFLVQAPQLGGAPGPIGSAYLTAPYAVLTGLAGSALAVEIGRRAFDRRARRVAGVPAAATARVAARRQARDVPTAVAQESALVPVFVSRDSPADPAPPSAAGDIGTDPSPPVRRRSTVARPPMVPPVAKINPPR